MRTALYGLLVATCGTCLQGADAITVPWQEFKEVWQRDVERQVMDRRPPAEPLSRWALDEARYDLTVATDAVSCRLRVTGRHLAGPARPIPLLPPGFVVGRVVTVAGGSLCRSEGDDGGFALLPTGSEPFAAELLLLLPIEEDRRSKFVRPPSCPAIDTALRLNLVGEVRLVEGPGLTDGDGVRHVASGTPLMVRFADGLDATTPSLVEVDVCSHLRTQGKRLLMTTHFAPGRVGAGPIVVRVAEGAQFIASSMRPSAMTRHNGRTFHITTPRRSPEPFWLQFALTETAVTLPTVDENDGAEGLLCVDEPEDGEMTLTSPGLSGPFGADRVAEVFRQALPQAREFRRLSAGEQLHVTIRRFASVRTAPIVLDEVHFHSSFEENGGSLSILTMTVPASVGARLTVGRVDGAEIWSLKVNGQPTKVFAHGNGDGDGDDDWVVPLAAGGIESRVELAYLRRGEKLGLRGRLDVVMPATSLPARDTHVTLGLPPRVKLVSVEGPVTSRSDAAGPAPLPAEFVGTPYGFIRNFDKGEGLSIAVFYREPVTPR